MKTKREEQLEELCEDLTLRLRMMKDTLRNISKALNIVIREEWRK